MDIFKDIGYILANNYVKLLVGLGYTILLAIVGTVVGLILGMGLAILRNLKVDKKKDKRILAIFKHFFSILSTCYIEFFRGTPMMVQAMVVYFGGAALGLNWNPLICGLIVISLNTAAYMAEIVRSGINAVDKGQIEAGRSLGMSNLKTNFFIVIPQALKISIPTIGNELIVNIKDSSVLNVIAVSELYYVGNLIAGQTYMTLQLYLIVAFMYLCVTLICSISLRQIEKKLDFDVHDRKKLKVVTLDE